MELTERFKDALDEAFRYHRNQTRKGPDDTPYMGHLLGVAAIVIDDGGSEDEAIAALLHDAPEDQGGEETLAEIRINFGENVAKIVADLSDTFDDPKPPWKQRKTEYLDHLKTVSDATLRVSIADKLYNVRSIALDRAETGEEVWARFTGSKQESLWYYETLGEIYRERMGEIPLVKGYLAVIDELTVG